MKYYNKIFDEFQLFSKKNMNFENPSCKVNQTVIYYEKI